MSPSSPSATAGPAPVALFAYRRPDHLAATARSLAADPLAASSDLHVFCDGPRQASDLPAVEQTRALARSLQGFRSVEVVESPVNLGLARSIIAGIGTILDSHDTVVVLEDDMVVSPHFLTFMNEGLERYKDRPEVASIHGYCYPLTDPRLPPSFFLRGADCWGWSTWRRAWSRFESDGSKLLADLRQRGLTDLFDFGGTYPYVRMLEDQIEGRNDSWAIRWYASAFLAEMVTLYPAKSLVENIGLDGSGTHCGVDPKLSPVEGLGGPPSSWPESTAECALAREAFARHFRSQSPPGPPGGWFRRLLRSWGGKR